MSLLSSRHKLQTVTGKNPTVKQLKSAKAQRFPNSKAIRMRLVEWDMSIAGLAQKLGWSRNYVSMLVHGYRVTPAAQRRIAKALGLGMEKAFPRREA